MTSLVLNPIKYLAVLMVSMLSILGLGGIQAASGNGVLPPTTLTLTADTTRISLGSNVSVEFNDQEDPLGLYFDIWICGFDNDISADVETRQRPTAEGGTDPGDVVDNCYLTSWFQRDAVSDATVRNLTWEFNLERSDALARSGDPYLDSSGTTLRVGGLSCRALAMIEGTLYMIVHDFADGNGAVQGGHSNWLEIANFDCPVTRSSSGGSVAPSISQILFEDTSGLDSNWSDADIMKLAYATVLAANPESELAALANPSTELTAFIPSDRAFRLLVTSLTGNKPSSESATLKAIRGLGPELLESILLHHVYLGEPLDAKTALSSSGTSLKSALGKSITLVLRDSGKVALRDSNRAIGNGTVISTKVDLIKGSKHIGHFVNRVILPYKTKKLIR